MAAVEVAAVVEVAAAVEGLCRSSSRGQILSRHLLPLQIYKLLLLPLVHMRERWRYLLASSSSVRGQVRIGRLLRVATNEARYCDSRRSTSARRHRPPPQIQIQPLQAGHQLQPLQADRQLSVWIQLQQRQLQQHRQTRRPAPPRCRCRSSSAVPPQLQLRPEPPRSHLAPPPPPHPFRKQQQQRRQCLQQQQVGRSVPLMHPPPPLLLRRLRSPVRLRRR